MANKKNENDGKGMNSATAGIVGAVVGAAVGAAAVALSDDKNRKIVQKKFEEYKKDGEKAYTDFKKVAGNVRDRVEEMSAKAGKQVQEAKVDTKKKLK